MKMKHQKFNCILQAMQSENRNSKNIMLFGQVGTGKTTICSQVADVLGLEFYPYSLCQQTTKSDLVGFIDAGGVYRTSALREAYQNGGLVLLDEMDAANPNVLSIVNNMLSNKQYYFPDGLVSKHQDFKCICAMNSNGRGGGMLYTKSNRLDASTLDRFIVINLDIDEALEQYLTDNKDWYERVLKFRQVISNICNDDMVVGTRAMLDGADLLEAGFSQSDVEDMVIYKGIDEDIVSKIKMQMDKTQSSGVVVRNKEAQTKNNFTIREGLVELQNSAFETVCYLDADYCEADNYSLAETIKQELGLH